MRKYWWDEEMNLLKFDAIKTHQAWLMGGKPRGGILFKERNKSKYKYKWKIKTNKKKEKQLQTSSLQDQLKNKNKTQFWKLWNSKFKGLKKLPTVDDVHTNHDTAEYFAMKFKETCMPNSSTKNAYLKKMFEEKCLMYRDKNNDCVTIDINTVSSVVMNLELGKF